jgi:hypothetical protein
MSVWWKSTTGWVLVTGYLVLAAFLFHEARTCTGWVCDLVALPAIVPFGFPIAWLTDWVHVFFPIPRHIPSFHLGNWYFILPTVLANAVFYFWLGRQFGKLAKLVLGRFK